MIEPELVDERPSGATTFDPPVVPDAGRRVQRRLAVPDVGPTTARRDLDHQRHRRGRNRFGHIEIRPRLVDDQHIGAHRIAVVDTHTLIGEHRVRSSPRPAQRREQLAPNLRAPTIFPITDDQHPIGQIPVER
nr:hypothetical protein [Nocardia aurantia]